MSQFRQWIEAPAGSKLVLQGNIAFAMGVVHAGYHSADGYPGTPSTEVIDKALSQVQDRIHVGWSVNEAVAVGVSVGHAVAGFDAMVTMKTPGAFQSADVITTSAFYNAPSGALVMYVASDYVPSSTQHVIDLRYFFASTRLPVLEPRSHQEMYDIAFYASDLSRQFNTPVVVYPSGILCHSEGMITTRVARTITPRTIPEDLKNWMGMPNLARRNYNHVTTVRIPDIRKWGEDSSLVTEMPGTEDWGIIVSGESQMIVQEAIQIAKRTPSILSLAIVYPLPIERIKAFAKKVKGRIFVIEDGDTFIEEKIRQIGINITGKEENSTITDWTPQLVLDFLSRHIDLAYTRPRISSPLKPLSRPPSICPGCPYRAFGLTVQKLRQQKKLYSGFGDIGCSTLLYFLNAIDTCLCMGASDSMRQGFVLSRPDMADKVISVLGDSCECHSGLDATRNAVFRNVPGVKIILDNRITAMTGGQPAPSSPHNLEGKPHKFVLEHAVEAEGARTKVVDSYNIKEVENCLSEALGLAREGVYSTLILRGHCIQEVAGKDKVKQLQIDGDLCKRCGRCGICPGIEHDEHKFPHFTNLCTNCGGSLQVCRQRCPFGAIVPVSSTPVVSPLSIKLSEMPEIKEDAVNAGVSSQLPETLRVAIRGIGGQGNLFFGKVLAEVAMLTPYKDQHIVKGETHGMAQLGGSVISTFACGKLYSPIFAPGSADVLVVMEMAEVLQPGFLDLIRKDGTIIFNRFTALPVTAKKEDYPDINTLQDILKPYRVIYLNANQTAYELGDATGRTANVIVLGLLSTISPFSQISKEIWLTALCKLSTTETIKMANSAAFLKGRSLNPNL